MQRTILLFPLAALGACATAGAYLNGNYNSEAFPALESPPEAIAMVTREQSEQHDAMALSTVDDLPIRIKPDGSGNGLWAKQVALTPGEHSLVASWRRPGQYSPASSLCRADFVAGHQYTVNYAVSPVGQTARVWIADSTDAAAITECTARLPPPVQSWPF